MAILKFPLQKVSFPGGITTKTLSFTTQPAAGKVLIGQTSADPSFTTVSGDVTVSSGGVTAIGSGKVLESMLSVPTAMGLGAVRFAHAKYDFAVDGGAVSTITLSSNATIPINAIIKRVLVSVGASFVGSTGNVSFGLTAGGAGVAALLAATARGSLTAGAIFEGIPVQGTASTANATLIKMSAAGQVTMTIATNALTAGRADVFIEYLVPSE